MLANFVQVLCLRLVGSFLISIPFRVAHILEMIVWGATLSVLSAQLLRSLRWGVLVPLCSGFICALMESPPRRLLLLSYPIMFGLVLWRWRQASRAQGLAQKSGATARPEDRSAVGLLF